MPCEETGNYGDMNTHREISAIELKLCVSCLCNPYRIISAAMIAIATAMTTSVQGFRSMCLGILIM